MKAFQLNNPKIIYFQNLERISGEAELENLKKELEAAGTRIGDKQQAGLEDIYPCKIGNMEFRIIFDGEEATVYAPDDKIKTQLLKIFE
jgi:hypothetical protein